MTDKRKPGFTRQDAHKKAKLAGSWRKPRGLQSKVRLKRRGYVRQISTGYGSAKSTRGTVKGLVPATISVVADLEGLDAKKHGAIIASGLGSRKRERLITLAKEKGITVLNLDAEKKLASIRERLANRQKDKAERVAAKEKKKKTLEEKAKKEAQKEKEAAKKDAEADALSDEDRKKQEEAEKQKVLTKKQ